MEHRAAHPAVRFASARPSRKTLVALRTHPALLAGEHARAAGPVSNPAPPLPQTYRRVNVPHGARVRWCTLAPLPHARHQYGDGDSERRGSNRFQDHGAGARRVKGVDGTSTALGVRVQRRAPACPAAAFGQCQQPPAGHGRTDARGGDRSGSGTGEAVEPIGQLQRTSGQGEAVRRAVTCGRRQCRPRGRPPSLLRALLHGPGGRRGVVGRVAHDPATAPPQRRRTPPLAGDGRSTRPEPVGAPRSTAAAAAQG